MLNAAAALARFEALKGRGAQFRVPVPGGTIEVIDESYNANPASMAAALALLGAAQAKGRRIAVLGDMLEMGPGGTAHHAAMAADIERASVDLVFANGTQMQALWEALPPSRRGAYGAVSSDIAPKLVDALAPGDVVLVKGSLAATWPSSSTRSRRRWRGRQAHVLLPGDLVRPSSRRLTSSATSRSARAGRS